MFNWHIPDAVYERLPLLYIFLALVASVLPSPLTLLKWIAVACLLLAAAVTRSRRSQHRRSTPSVPPPSTDAGVYVIDP